MKKKSSKSRSHKSSSRKSKRPSARNDKQASRRARSDRKKGKSSSTQASNFVGEEMHRKKHGDKSIKSRKQAIAIGLSKARRHGIRVPKKKKSKAA